MSRAAVIVAAGRGERMGLPDKVLLSINGEPVIQLSLRAADAASRVEQIVVVAGAHCREQIAGIVERLKLATPVTVVEGGARRQDSVLSGVVAARSLGASVVAVHDGARPLVPPALFDQTLDAAERSGAAIAAVPVVDTIKRVHDGQVVETVPRDELCAAQTPQAFVIDRLLAAFAEADRLGLTVTDEAGLFEALAWPVVVVPGDPMNLKLTYPGDITLLEALATSRAASERTSIV
jgi:2-C-methyl-D-erythritol 4-phosphate cytidylyltransferase